MVTNEKEGRGNIDWDVSILRKFSKFSIINAFDRKENKTKKNIVNWFNFKTAAYVTMFSVLCVAIVLTVHFVLPQGRTLTASVETNCGIEEHKHSPDCYDADGNVVCGKIEHYHTSDCFAQNVADYVDYKCGFDYAHEHSDDCYKNGVLTCSLTEHHHTVRCLFDGSNYGDACDEYITACTRLVKTLDYTSNEEYINLIKSDVDDVAAFINEAYDSNAIYTSQYNDLKAQVTALTNDFNAQVAEQIEASKAPETADNDNEDLPVEVVPVKKEAGEMPVYYDPNTQLETTETLGKTVDGYAVAYAIKIGSNRADNYPATTVGTTPWVDTAEYNGQAITYENYELKLWYWNGGFYADGGHHLRAQYVDYIADVNYPDNRNGALSFSNVKGANNWTCALVNNDTNNTAVGATDYPTTVEQLLKNIRRVNAKLVEWAHKHNVSSLPRIARVVIEVDTCINVSSKQVWGYYYTDDYNEESLSCSDASHPGLIKGNGMPCNISDVYIRRGDVSSSGINTIINISDGDGGNSVTNLYVGSEVIIDNNSTTGSETGDICVNINSMSALRLVGGRIINSKATSSTRYGSAVLLSGSVSAVRCGEIELFSGAVIEGFVTAVRVDRGTVRFCQQTPYIVNRRYADVNNVVNSGDYGVYSQYDGRTSYADLSRTDKGILLIKQSADKAKNPVYDPYIVKMHENSLEDMPQCKVTLAGSQWASTDVIIGSGYTEQAAFVADTPYIEVDYNSDGSLAWVKDNGTEKTSGARYESVVNSINYLLTRPVGERCNAGRTKVQLTRADLNGFDLTYLDGRFDTEFVAPNSAMSGGDSSMLNWDDRYPCLRIANEEAKVYLTRITGQSFGGWFPNLTKAVNASASFSSQTDRGTFSSNISSGTPSFIVWGDTEEDTVLTASGTGPYRITDGIIFNVPCIVRNADDSDGDKEKRDYVTFKSGSKHDPDNTGHNQYTIKWTKNTSFNTDWPGQSGKESQGHVVYNLDYCMIVKDDVAVTFGGAQNGSLTFDAGSNDFEMVNIKGVDFLFQIDSHEHSAFTGHSDKIQNPLICLRKGAKLNLGTASGRSKVILTNGSVPAEALANHDSGAEPGQDTRACGIMMKDSNELHMYPNSKITHSVGFWGGAIYTQGSDCVVDIHEDTEISYITSMRSPLYLINDASVTIDGCLFEHNYCRFGLLQTDMKYKSIEENGITRWVDNASCTAGDKAFTQKVNSAGGRGGAIYIADGADVSISDSKFMYNACDVYGGAIYTTDNDGSQNSPKNGYLTVNDTEFCYNFAVRGGAVQVDGFERKNVSPSFVTTFNGCYFHNNIAYAADSNELTYNTTGVAGAYRSYTGIQNGSSLVDTSSGRGGAIRVTDPGTDLTLNDCVIVDNIAETRGGGICISDNNDVILNNTIIAENYAKDTTYNLPAGQSKLLVSKPTADYTGMTLDSADFNIGSTPGEFKASGAGERCNFRNEGGGIAIDNDNNTNIATLTINGTSLIGKKVSATSLPTNFGFTGLKDTYTGNYAYDGGGVHAIASNEIYFNAGDISDNVAKSEGGGVYAKNNVDIIVTAGNTNRNEAYRRGGGYYLMNSATLTFNGGEVKNNFTTHTAGSSNETYGGGGIYCQDTTTVLINGAAIENNISGGNGGGILANGSSASHTIVTFTKGTIKNNATRAGGVSSGTLQCKGGGIYACQYSKILMNAANNAYNGTPDATVKSNTSVNGAGVFLDDDALMEITGGDISSNVATQDGGGMFINKRATANLTSDVRISVTNNTAVNGAGINVVTDAATSSSAIADCTLNGTSNPLVLQNNAASGNGGAIRIASGGYVESKGKTSKIYIGNTSNRNTAGGDGGGVYITGRYTGNSQNILSTFNMKAGQIMYNTAVGDGGGVCIKDYGVMYLSDKDNASQQHINIHSNTATDGTGIYQDGKLYLNGGPLFYASGTNNLDTSANDIYLAAQVVTTDTAALTDVIEPNSTTATVHVITKNGPISDNIKDTLTDWPNSASRTSTGGTVSIPVTLGQMAGAQGGNNFDGRDYVVSLNGTNENSIADDGSTVILDDLTKFWVKNPTVYDCIYNDSANSKHQDKLGNDDINDVAVLELDIKQTYSIDVQKQVGLDENMYPSFNPTTVAYDTNSGVSKTFNYTATITNGTFDAVTFGGTHAATPVKTNNTTITFALKSGENLLIENLAPGSNVTITEDNDSKYNEYSKLDAAFGENEALSTEDRDQTISNLNASHEVYFKNTPIDRMLLVAKRAGDDSTVQVGTFTFKLIVTDFGGSPVQVPVLTTGTYATTSGLATPSYNTSTGEMTFTLGFNQQMVFNIPYGYKARVEEVEAPGFSTMVKCNGSGLGTQTTWSRESIANVYTFDTVNQNKAAYFFNTASAELPHTIGVNINIFTAAGMSIMLLAVAAAFVVRAYARKH